MFHFASQKFPQSSKRPNVNYIYPLILANQKILLFFVENDDKKIVLFWNMQNGKFYLLFAMSKSPISTLQKSLQFL